MGIFWDWCSLPQKDPRLFDETETPEGKPEAERAAFRLDLKAKRRYFGGEQYEKSRTAAERSSFAYGLSQTMDLWYAHRGTVVYMLTRLPEGAARKWGYEDSGWTTYERCSAEQIKKASLERVSWRLVLDLGAEKTEVHSLEEAAPRSWPIGPDDFDALIGTKQFTNGSDHSSMRAASA